jgi:DNA-binding transcriptional ArsR family regulator
VAHIQNTSPLLNEETTLQVAELFRALGDPSRVRILSVLCQGEIHVGALANAVQLSESAVSHHLRGLRQLRLVRPRKNGRHVYYCVDDDHIVDLFHRGVEHVLHS